MTDCALCRAPGPVLLRTDCWTVTALEPAAGARLRFRLVPFEHVPYLHATSPAAWADYWTAREWVKRTYGLTYYCTASPNGATVAHAYEDLVVGDPASPVTYRYDMSEPASHAGYLGSGLARCGAPPGAYTVAPGEPYTCTACPAPAR